MAAKNDMAQAGDLQAVVLAGGAGSRLRPALPDLPKVLAPVAGKPFLLHIVERLKRQGVRRILLLVGHRAEEVASCLRDGQSLGVAIAYSVDDAPRGTGGALWGAAGLLAPTFLLLNGDTIADIDLARLASYHRGAGSLITAVGTQFAGRPDPDTGYLLTGRGGRALSFVRGTAPARLAAGQGVWACSGWQVCERRIVEQVTLPPGAGGGSFSFEDGFLGPLLERTVVYPLSTPYWDIGTPDRYRRLQREWQNHDLS